MMRITTDKTTSPDFSGWRFYVEQGCEFDDLVFEEAYPIVGRLTTGEIDFVNEQTRSLKRGEWLEVIPPEVTA